MVEVFLYILIYNVEEVASAIKEMFTKDILRSLPGLNCGQCGYDTCLGLAKTIQEGEATRESCEVRSTKLTTLTVDGRVVPLGRFPQEALREITLGVLNTLKGVGKPPQNVEIAIRTEEAS